MGKTALSREQRADLELQRELRDIPDCGCVTWTPCDCPACIGNFTETEQSLYVVTLPTGSLTESIAWKSQPWNNLTVTIQRRRRPIHEEDSFLTPPCKHILSRDFQPLFYALLDSPELNLEIQRLVAVVFGPSVASTFATSIHGDSRDQGWACNVWWAAWLRFHWDDYNDPTPPRPPTPAAVAAYKQYRRDPLAALAAGDRVAARMIRQHEEGLMALFAQQVVTRPDRVENLALRCRLQMPLWNPRDLINANGEWDDLGLPVDLTDGNNRPVANEVTLETCWAPPEKRWDEDAIEPWEDIEFLPFAAYKARWAAMDAMNPKPEPAKEAVAA